MKSPTESCHNLYTASLLTTDTSNTLESAGSDGPSGQAEALQPGTSAELYSDPSST